MKRSSNCLENPNGCSTRLLRGTVVAFPAIFLLLAELWPLVVQGELPAGYDMVLWYYPGAAFAHFAWARGSIPFWNPFEASGAPFLADPDFAVLYPVNLVLEVVASPSMALRLSIVFHLLLAYFGVFGFLRTIGVGRPGAIFSAMTYGFSAFIVDLMNVPNILSSVALFPVVLLLLERALQEASLRGSIRWAAASGIAFGILLLSGAPQWAFYVGLVIAGYTVSHMGNQASRRPPTMRLRELIVPVLICAIIVVVSVGVYAIQLLPSLEFLAESNYSTNYVSDVSGGLQLADLVSFFYGDQHIPSLATVPFLSSYLLILAIFAVIYRPSRHALYFGIAAVGSLALAFQLPPDIQTVLHKVPGFTQFLSHIPERILFVTVFSLAVLGGIGVDRLLTSKSTAANCRGTFAIVTGAVAVALAIPIVSNRVHAANIILFIVIFAAPVAVIALQVIRKLAAPVAQVSFIALAGSGLVLGVFDYREVFQDLEDHFRSSATAPILEQQKTVTLGRVLGVDPSLPWFGYDSLAFSPPLITGNSAWVYGLQDIQGYNSLYVKRYRDYLDALNQGTPIDYHIENVQDISSRLLDYLNVRYFVTRSPTTEVNAVLGGGIQLTVRQPSWSHSYSDRVPTDRLVVLSSLANSVNVVDGQKVADVFVETSDGNRFELPIRAGIDTSEWSYDQLTIQSKIRHRRAKVASSADTGQGYLAHLYITTLTLPRPSIIRNLDINFVPVAAEPNLVVAINQIRAPQSVQAHAEVLATVGGYDMWRLKSPLPRAMLVPATEVASSDEEALKRMQDVSFDPRQRVLFSANPPSGLPILNADALDAGKLPVGTANVVKYDLNEIRVATTAPSPAVLVLSEIYYPAWHASIDGRPAAVYRVNYMFRGVAVPPGQHEVTVYYQDQSFIIGAVISILTIVVAATVILYFGWSSQMSNGKDSGFEKLQLRN